MPQEVVVTPAQFSGALQEGVVLAVLLVAVTHLLRLCARSVLFLVLLIAAFAYVRFAVIGQAGPVWVSIEVLGLVVYGAIGWRGLDGSLWWLIAAWALHPVWDMALHYFGSGRSFVDPLAWPIPCLSFDLIVAGYLAYLQARKVAHPFHARR